MKIVEFFFIIWGKWSKLEPEPEFLTSWSRSRTAQKWTGSATLMGNIAGATSLIFTYYGLVLRKTVFRIRIHNIRIRIQPFWRMRILIQFRIRIQIQANSEQIFFRVKIFCFIKESHFLQALFSQIYVLLNNTGKITFYDESSVFFRLILHLLDPDPGSQ
jgi:hypothetical protein